MTRKTLGYGTHPPQTKILHTVPIWDNTKQEKEDIPGKLEAFRSCSLLFGVSRISTGGAGGGGGVQLEDAPAALS